MKHGEYEDCEKSECIISELGDNFKWATTCVTGVKGKQLRAGGRKKKT